MGKPENKSCLSVLFDIVIRIVVIGGLIYGVRYIRPLVSTISRGIGCNRTLFSEDNASTHLIIPGIIGLIFIFFIVNKFFFNRKREKAALFAANGENRKALVLYLDLISIWTFKSPNVLPKQHMKSMENVMDLYEELAAILAELGVPFSENFKKIFRNMADIIYPKSTLTFEKTLSDTETVALDKENKAFQEEQKKLLADIREYLDNNE